jgi:holo-[acyl-carrier protein] synthase
MSALAPTVPSSSLARMAESLRSETVDQATRAWWNDGPWGAGPDRAVSPGPVRVGVDLVPVADVAASVERLGRRYLYRVFTPHERACARIGAHQRGSQPVGTPDRSRDPSGSPVESRYSMESLAARFAAKEAAVKVLRPVGARPEWRSIEVRRVDGGWCELRLSGLAAILAAEADITISAVSVTHEPMLAAACVVGTRRGDGPAWCRTPPPDQRGK